MTKMITIDDDVLNRALCALSRAADELSRAAMVIAQEADGERPRGRTIKTLHDIATAMRSQALACTSAEHVTYNAWRAATGLPAIERAA
jgi:hypothetical protein